MAILLKKMSVIYQMIQKYLSVVIINLKNKKFIRFKTRAQKVARYFQALQHYVTPRIQRFNNKTNIFMDLLEFNCFNTFYWQYVVKIIVMKQF